MVIRGTGSSAPWAELRDKKFYEDRFAGSGGALG